MKFKTEKEAIGWVIRNTPFAIKPTKVSKTGFVAAFKTQHAFNQVTTHLGKELFELQNKN